MDEKNTEQNQVNAETIGNNNNQSEITVKPKQNMKKTLLIISGILLVLIVICCAIFVGIFYFVDLNLKRNLKTVENSDMVFYYPESYEKLEAESGNFTYQKSEKNSVGGNDNIRTVSKASLDGVDFSDKGKCDDTTQELGKQIRKTLYIDSKDIVITDVLFSTQNSSTFSCSFTFEVKTFDKNYNSVKVYNKYKLIEKNGKKVGVSSFYEDNTPADEQDQVDRSVRLFNIK